MIDTAERPEHSDDGDPHVVVLFGAMGDLAKRKLLPGLFHLSMSKLTPAIRVVGVSLDDITTDDFPGRGQEGVSRVLQPKSDLGGCRRVPRLADLRLAG